MRAVLMGVTIDPTLRYTILPRAFEGRSYWADLPTPRAQSAPWRTFRPSASTPCSRRKGTTFVTLTASSSVSENPVTFFPQPAVSHFALPSSVCRQRGACGHRHRVSLRSFVNHFPYSIPQTTRAIGIPQCPACRLQKIELCSDSCKALRASQLNTVHCWPDGPTLQRMDGAP
jgi:hypothetical protein